MLSVEGFLDLLGDLNLPCCDVTVTALPDASAFLGAVKNYNDTVIVTPALGQPERIMTMKNHSVPLKLRSTCLPH